MANTLDSAAVRSMAKHRGKLMALVESTKRKRKKKRWAVPPSNIEHLVFRRVPTSPVGPGPALDDSCDEKSELRANSVQRVQSPPSGLLYNDRKTNHTPKMGLDSNCSFNGLACSGTGTPAEDVFPFDKSPDDEEMSENPYAKPQSKIPVVLRIRTRSTSRSEREFKGKSTSELCVRSVHKTRSDPSQQKKRPSSQFYDTEDENAAEPDARRDSYSSSNQLHIVVSPVPQSLPKQLASTPLVSDSLMQRFRKSFAVRFKRKTEDPVPMLSKSLTDDRPKLNANCVEANRISTPLKTQLGNGVPKTAPSGKARNIPSVLSGNQRGRKAEWRRSLFYDSVDNVLNASTNVESGNMPYLSGSDANILRRRTPSDNSPKSKEATRPVSIFDNTRLEHSDLNEKDQKPVTSSEHTSKSSSFDQGWRTNPVKLCRVHSHLLTCPQKGRYRLRRSISQPVELEMSPSMQNFKETIHGSVDDDSFIKNGFSSDEDASSESDMYSQCCSPSRPNACCELSDGAILAEALWDHDTLDSEELPFQAGDIIEVTDMSDQDWWWGTKNSQEGWFPAAFVRLYANQRCPSLHGAEADGLQNTYSPCKVGANNLSSEQVRANIIQEIIVTERDYVKHLKDVVEGYLKQVHRRPDMFSRERIETIFGNIKEIFNFQCQFLSQLESSLNNDAYHLSQVGNCFLDHKEEFKMYSHYCNNHPLAISELQELYCDSHYTHFFEACRLLREMIDISLDGFLLTPIQRICKYPLQLAELLKYTDKTHPDHVPVSNALSAMKEVAELVNERKRRMECLERIAEWQSTIEGWEGPEVLDTSSILIHCGEVTRVSSSWSRDIYLFIFDHLLIYCKKDLLKRQTYAYKGRLNLDHCDIVDTEDGKDCQFAINVKNAWKIYCQDKDKWYLFYAKTAPEKDQWLKAFKSEKLRIKDDEKQAFVVTEEAKKSARLAVHNKHKPKRPRAKFTKGRRCHPDVAVTELLLDTPSAKARSGSLPSSIHPELAIMTGAKLGPTRKKGSGWFHFGSGKKPKS